MSKQSVIDMDDLMLSPEYAEWVQLNGIEYGFIISNGDSLLEAMESEKMVDAYTEYMLTKTIDQNY